MSIDLQRFPILNRAAKRVVPLIAAPLRIDAVHKMVAVLGVGLDILQGKGSGSGWDIESEVRVAAQYIQSQRPIIFDVGANVGQWSSRLTKYVARNSRFFLFEPASSSIAKISVSDLPLDTKIIQCAIGKEIGEATLFVSHEAGQDSSLFTRKDSYFLERSYVEEKVSLRSIDSIVEEYQIDKVDFMKIDVEGAELDVLQGARRSLSRGIILCVSFEFGSANINSRIFFRDIFDFLSEMGFSVFRVCPGGFLIEVKKYSELNEYFRGATNYIARKI